MGGVPDEISEEQIVEHFGRWGSVVDVYFPGKKGAKRVRRASDKACLCLCRLSCSPHSAVAMLGTAVIAVGPAAEQPHILTLQEHIASASAKMDEVAVLSR